MQLDITQYLLQMQSSIPQEWAPLWAEIQNSYTRGMWNKLALHILEFMKLPGLQETQDAVIELYNNFIFSFIDRIDKFAVIEIASIVCQFKPLDEKVDFLQGIVAKVQGVAQAHPLALLLLAEILLKKGDKDYAIRLMEEAGQLLSNTDGTPIHARYYKLICDFCFMNFMSPHLFYKAALSYLACTDVYTLMDEERKQLAFKLGISAILAEGVYCFANLLVHPIMDSIKHSEFGWLFKLLEIYQTGDVAAFHKEMPSGTGSELLTDRAFMEQKMAIFALMRTVRQAAGSKLSLSFDDIAGLTWIQNSFVEAMLLKCLNRGLFGGICDVGNSIFYFTWSPMQAVNSTVISSVVSLPPSKKTKFDKVDDYEDEIKLRFACQVYHTECEGDLPILVVKKAVFHYDGSHMMISCKESEHVVLKVDLKNEKKRWMMVLEHGWLLIDVVCTSGNELLTVGGTVKLALKFRDVLCAEAVFKMCG